MPKLGYFEIGTYNFQCDECGRWFKATSIRKRWDGAWVCDTGTCWEPRQPQDFQRGVKDDPSVPIARPRILPTGASINYFFWTNGPSAVTWTNGPLILQWTN